MSYMQLLCTDDDSADYMERTVLTDERSAEVSTLSDSHAKWIADFISLDVCSQHEAVEEMMKPTKNKKTKTRVASRDVRGKRGKLGSSKSTLKPTNSCKRKADSSALTAHNLESSSMPSSSATAPDRSKHVWCSIRIAPLHDTASGEGVSQAAWPHRRDVHATAQSIEQSSAASANAQQPKKRMLSAMSA